MYNITYFNRKICRLPILVHRNRCLCAAYNAPWIILWNVHNVWNMVSHWVRPLTCALRNLRVFAIFCSDADTHYFYAIRVLHGNWICGDTQYLIRRCCTLENWAEFARMINSTRTVLCFDSLFERMPPQSVFLCTLHRCEPLPILGVWGYVWNINKHAVQS